MQNFETGATKSSSDNKPDYEGYLSPLAIHRFGQYMSKHQIQEDGSKRQSDNWQKGIPKEQYMKSLWRHFMDMWLHHRKQEELTVEDKEESLCAIIFNAQGYLHEILKDKYEE